MCFDSWVGETATFLIVTIVNPMILSTRIYPSLNEHSAHPYPQEESKLESIL